MQLHTRFHLRRDCTKVPTRHRRRARNNPVRRVAQTIGMITGVAVFVTLLLLIVTGVVIALAVLALEH